MSNSAPIVIETHRAPIYVVRFRGRATPAEYQAYLDELTLLIRQPFEARRVVINDATGWALSTASERAMQARWVTDHQHDLRRTVDAVGFVFGSALMRGALKAVFWLQPLPVQHQVFATFDDALSWARGRVGNQPSQTA